MLVLGRNVNERLILTTATGERIEILVVKVSGTKVRLGIEAPDSVRVIRSELEEADDDAEYAA